MTTDQVPTGADPRKWWVLSWRGNCRAHLWASAKREIVADPLEDGRTPSTVLAVIKGLGDPHCSLPQILEFLVRDGEVGVVRTVVAVAVVAPRLVDQGAAVAVDSKTDLLVLTWAAVAGDGLVLFQKGA